MIDEGGGAYGACAVGGGEDVADQWRYCLAVSGIGGDRSA